MTERSGAPEGPAQINPSRVAQRTQPPETGMDNLKASSIGAVFSNGVRGGNGTSLLLPSHNRQPTAAEHVSTTRA